MNAGRGRLAVVTASASGIGLVTATTLAREGWRVVMSDIDDTAGEAQAVKIGAAYRHCDLRRPDDIAALFEDLGTVHTLVNNGGLSGPVAPVVDMPLDAWQECFDVNITAQFLACKAALPGMIAAGQGVIVNMSSVAGVIGYPNRSPYAATKWAVRGFTATLAQEVADQGIRVNAILPGAVRGERMEAVIEAYAQKNAMTPAEAERHYLGRQARPAFIEPEEVAETILFLASDKARSITGQSIQVCGGFQ